MIDRINEDLIVNVCHEKCYLCASDLCVGLISILVRQKVRTVRFQHLLRLIAAKSRQLAEAPDGLNRRLQKMRE